jgi:TrmH family RNA methyltransferase
MISRQKTKYIKSLQLKKYQKQEQKFLVEGEKSVLEILNSRYKINILLGTKRFLEIYRHKIPGKNIEVEEVTEKELEKAGTLKTNNAALAVVEIPEKADLDEGKIRILPVFENLKVLWMYIIQKSYRLVWVHLHALMCYIEIWNPF